MLSLWLCIPNLLTCRTCLHTFIFIFYLHFLTKFVHVYRLCLCRSMNTQSMTYHNIHICKWVSQTNFTNSHLHLRISANPVAAQRPGHSTAYRQTNRHIKYGGPQISRKSNSQSFTYRLDPFQKSSKILSCMKRNQTTDPKQMYLYKRIHFLLVDLHKIRHEHAGQDWRIRHSNSKDNKIGFLKDLDFHVKKTRK